MTFYSTDIEVRTAEFAAEKELAVKGQFFVDNCGEIKWSYTDNKGDTIIESLDLDTANEFLEIKDFGRSALDVQKLLEAVGIE